MNHFICNTLLGQLRGVTGRQEGKLGIGELRPYDVEQLEVLLSVKFERSLEWLTRLEYSMAYNMGKPMIAEACPHSSRCSFCGEESRDLGIDRLYGLHFLECE